MTSGVLTSYLAEPHSAVAPPIFAADQFGEMRSSLPDRQLNVYRTRPQQFSMDQFANYHNLCTVYEYLREVGGQAAGIDGIRPEHVSKSERNEIISQIIAELREGTYTPLPPLIQECPKPSGGVRRLSIPALFDRMVIKAILLCLQRFWRQQLPGLGRDVWITYAIMQQTIYHENKYILSIDDIRDCYPTAPIGDVLELQQYHLRRPALYNLIERIIRGPGGLNHQTGLGQGSPYSPVAMETFLHHRLDDVIRTNHPGITQLRYVDNLTYLSRSVEEGQQALRTANQHLERFQMSLKGQDGPPQDIRDPQHNRSILGLIPRWHSNQLRFAIPASAYQHLETGLTTTNGQSKSPEAIRRTLTGWLNAMGPALTNTMADRIVEEVTNICQRKGIREFKTNELLRTAKTARKRWLKLTERYR